MTVSTETLRQDIYSTIRNLLVANKPSYTYDGTDYEYSVVASYGRQASSFPYVVLSPAQVNVTLLNMDGSGEDYDVSVQLDFYALEIHRKKAIDVGIDSVRNTLISNQSSLASDGLYLTQEPFDESNTTPFEDRQQVINTGSLIINMRLK